MMIKGRKDAPKRARKVEVPISVDILSFGYTTEANN